jgi:hypothetical protein
MLSELYGGLHEPREVLYLNHENFLRWRKIKIIFPFLGMTPWHKDYGLYLQVLDLETGKERTFDPKRVWAWRREDWHGEDQTGGFVKSASDGPAGPDQN